MKAAILKSDREIVIEEIPKLPPNDGEVQVKVMSCGICGSDIPRVLNNGAHFYPLILGHEFYGVIEELGPGVTSIHKGDHVVGIPLKPCFKCNDCKAGNYALCKNYKFIGSSLNGAYQEYINISHNNVFKIDDNIAGVYCALFEPSAVGLHAVRFYSNYKTKNVAIVGGGTIGTMIAKWAKIYGAKQVALFEKNLDNINIYKQLGLGDVFVSNESGFFDAKDKLDISNGFDVVFDAVGIKPTILFSLGIAKNKGNVCLVGTPTSDIVFSQKEWEIINRKELTLKGSWMCYSKPFPGIEWKETNDKLISGELSFSKDFFAGFYRLDEVKDAFSFIEKSKNNRVGRVLLLMDVDCLSRIK